MPLDSTQQVATCGSQFITDRHHTCIAMLCYKGEQFAFDVGKVVPVAGRFAGDESLQAFATLPSRRYRRLSHRKEVIQPHLPVRLPCYDFTLLTRRTFDVVPHCWLD